MPDIPEEASGASAEESGESGEEEEVIVVPEIEEGQYLHGPLRFLLKIIMLPYEDTYSFIDC